MFTWPEKTVNQHRILGVNKVLSVNKLLRILNKARYTLV